MRVDVITLFPGVFEILRNYGITRRACQRGALRLTGWNPRDHTTDRHRTVDDRSYGGGPGMVMRVQPLRDTLYHVRAAADSRGKVIYLSPQGRPFDQAGARELSQARHLILIAGRYEGIDERFVESYVDEEWSIGDYVLSGGELAVAVVIDAVARMLPDVLGNKYSVEHDSFEAGLLDYPHYTRPERVDGLCVPPVLLSGDHAAISRWRLRESLGRTWLRRPDLLAKLRLSAEQQTLLNDFIKESRQKSENAGLNNREVSSDSRKYKL
jgi:tRNA (guanine37-N1)-methyltransferase